MRVFYLRRPNFGEFIHSLLGVVLLSIVTLPLLLFGCATGPRNPTPVARGDYQPLEGAISELVRSEMKKYNVQGLSIALVDDQRIVWAEGFGYADVNKKVPAKPETVYAVGSIAKLFTTLATLQLSEKRKIDLDQPLQSYLPEFSIKTRFQNSASITPRTILTHHSGLPSERLGSLIRRDSLPVSELLKGMKDDYVASPPNYVFSYSNLAFRVLGHTVERVSGQPFASYMEEHVFRPMGMRTASFALRPDLEPVLSKGYRQGTEAEEFLFRHEPSPEGSLYASVLDLSRLLQMVFAQGMVDGRRILQPETVAEMLRPQNSQVPLDFDFRIGLGWFLNDVDIRKAGPVASHGGALSLFFSQLVILPEQRLGVVVLANSSSALYVVNRVAEEALKLGLEVKTGIRAQKVDDPAPERVPPWSERILPHYVGYYATPARVYTVTAKGEKLQTRMMGRPVELVPHPGGLFSVQYKLLGAIPIRLKPLEAFQFSVPTIEGRSPLVLHNNGKKQLVGEKIEPPSIPEAWLKRVGEYELVHGSDYWPMIEKTALTLEKPLLMIDVTIPLLGEFGIERMRFALCPVSDREAILAGLGRNMGETIRVVERDGEERLLYSGLEFRKKTP